MNKSVEGTSFGLVVLAALAAQGKDFDRAGLNAMLERLAASPEPKIAPRASAMCYAIAVPELKRYAYACPVCGAKTTYPPSRERFGHRLTVATGCSAASDFFVVGPNGMIRVCNHSPVELVRWDRWRSLGDESAPGASSAAHEEWMHYVRHDRMPAMCGGCEQAGRCRGGCREAARVFRGSPTAPDPIFKE